MTHDTVPVSEASELIEALSSTGGYLLPGRALSRLIGVTAADWSRFALNWEDLTLDTHMADGGRYRYRRYGQYDLDVATETLTPLPHAPYRQESDVNPLNGGVDREFDPPTERFTADPLLRSLLTALGRIFTAVDGTVSWNIRLHPYRVIGGAEAGLPAPEGRHRDGVTFITSLLIKRTNVSGGESSVYTEDGGRLLRATLTEPGDLLLGDDRRTLHDVSPVLPTDAGSPAYRDVLVIAYTAR